MNSGRTVFSLLMEFIPTYQFQLCVDRYQGNRYVKDFSGWAQFFCLAFAQLTDRTSLRDLETCLRAQQPRLYHLGFRGRFSIGVPGTAARRFFHGPGLNNWDFALHKITRVNERLSTEFRAEFFNLFNHAQFLNQRFSGGNVASSQFGRVSRANPGRIGQLGLRLIF